MVCLVPVFAHLPCSGDSYPLLLLLTPALRLTYLPDSDKLSLWLFIISFRFLCPSFLAFLLASDASTRNNTIIPPFMVTYTNNPVSIQCSLPDIYWYRSHFGFSAEGLNNNSNNNDNPPQPTTNLHKDNKEWSLKGKKSSFFLQNLFVCCIAIYKTNQWT